MHQPKETGLFLLKRLWSHVKQRRRSQFGMLLGMMMLTFLAEIFSLGAVLPFLGVLTSPETIFDHPILQPVIRGYGISSPDELLLPITIMFGVAAIIAGGIRLLQIWANTRISFATGTDLSILLYQKTLYQPYSVHVARNSSEIIDAVSTQVNAVVFQIIVPLLTLLSSSVIMVAIMATLIAINPFIAITAFGGFGGTYALIIKLTRGRLKQNGQRIAKESKQLVKTLQEGLGGIRDILINRNQPLYCKIYGQAVAPLRRAQGNNQFMSQSPRFVIEAIGMLLIAALAYALARQPGGVAQAIPVLGALALGAQRLLPVLQQTYGSWSSLQGGQASLRVVLELLDQPVAESSVIKVEEPLPFKKQLDIKQLSFRYTPTSPDVLHHLKITIPKGSRVGFIGATGSGKSTLLDIVMGLLQPTKGSLEVDGQTITQEKLGAWQRHIAHVPQAIYLSDATIAENIAFGVQKEKIDHERVRLAARQAQMAELVESWPDQYQTVVGERGIRLSGGQRQRIGIARALYKQADVIIFDEATSALDNQTEAAVMQAIEELHEDLTVLIIAHRLTTLRNCDTIVELANSRIHAVGSYEEIVATRNGSPQSTTSNHHTPC